MTSKIKHLTVRVGEYHEVPGNMVIHNVWRINSKRQQVKVDHKVKHAKFKILNKSHKGEKCKVAVEYTRYPVKKFAENVMWPFPASNPVTNTSNERNKGNS